MYKPPKADRITCAITAIIIGVIIFGTCIFIAAVTHIDSKVTCGIFSGFYIVFTLYYACRNINRILYEV